MLMRDLEKAMEKIEELEIENREAYNSNLDLLVKNNELMQEIQGLQGKIFDLEAENEAFDEDLVEHQTHMVTQHECEIGALRQEVAYLTCDFINILKDKVVIKFERLKY